MKSPPIDSRNSKDIQEKIKQIIPYYLPEWNPKESEPGWAISQLFSDMASDVIERLNKVPENLFLDFLEKMGFKLLPSKPSKAPVVFEMVKNRKENINIKKGTKLSSSDGVIFETEEDFTVSSAKLVNIYSVNPELDSINEHINGKESILFKKKPQKHYFYAGDDSLFNLNKTHGKKLTLYMFPPFDAEWEYYIGKDEDGNEIWEKFKKIEKIITKQPTKKELKHVETLKIKFQNAKEEIERLNIIKEYEKIVQNLQTKEIRFYKINTASTAKKEINGINTFWIRARLGKEHGHLNKNNIFEIKGISGIDSLFYNDVPLNIKDLLNGNGKEIYPFGIEPKVGDSFYISSNEAFSKRNGKIFIKFCFSSNSTFTEEENGNNPHISWEYWNGKSWKSLKVYFPKNEELEELIDKRFKCPSGDKTPEIMKFICPPDISQIEVNGEKNYWIRGRITGLSYGKYEVVDNKVVPKFNPPKLNKIQIQFDVNLIPEHSYTYNNLEYQKVKDVIKNLYIPLPDRNKTVYLGFDSHLGEGNINIFFSLINPYWNEKKYLKWSYWDGNHWQELPVKDRTENLKESGIFQFVSPKDLNKKSIFSKDLYWLRLEITYLKADEEKEKIKPVKEKIQINETSNECIKILDILGNLLQKEKKEQIKLFGIYPNTVYAVQQQTIKNEILGSSDGSPNQTFKIKHTPVINAEIWVKEQTEPEEETTYYQDKDYYWVLWKEIQDLDFSCENCRHYSLDKVSGEVKFGNGIKGKIPPIGKDSIKANYKTGGGEKGNLPEKSIKNLVTSTAYIDKIYNVEPASGGSEPEKTKEILERIPKKLRHRERAVNLYDYEALTKEASTKIAKLKVIPKLNDRGSYQTGWITVVIFPYSKEKKPEVSKGLIKNVENYLKSKSTITVRLQVIPPVYGEVNIDLSVVISDFSKFSEVKNRLKESLTNFLNPVTGNIDGKGWDFGQIPCYSDFFTVINTVEGILDVKRLKVLLKAEEKELPIVSDITADIKIPPYLLTVPGEINIEITGEK